MFENSKNQTIQRPELLEIQVESKQKMQVKDWLRGAKINSGDFLG